MILVTLGTQDKPFKRLVKEIDNLVKTKKIKDEVIMQVGLTPYDGPIKHFDFVNDEEMDLLVEKCDLLITHAGVGMLLKGMSYNKKIIAVPRLKKYHEHLNNHQLEITNDFVQRGAILSVTDIKDLEKTIKQSKKFIPTPLALNTKEITDTIEEFIEKI